MIFICTNTFQLKKWNSLRKQYQNGQKGKEISLTSELNNLGNDKWETYTLLYKPSCSCKNHK